jgi:hypothetical protein
MATPPSDEDLLSNPRFSGLFQRLSLDKDASDVPSAAEVVDDYEGEQESLDLQCSTGDNGEDDADDDNSEDGEEDGGDDSEASMGFSGLKNVVKNASKGVTEGTDGGYRRSEHTNFVHSSLTAAY